MAKTTRWDLFWTWGGHHSHKIDGKSAKTTRWDLCWTWGDHYSHIKNRWQECVLLKCKHAIDGERAFCQRKWLSHGEFWNTSRDSGACPVLTMLGHYHQCGQLYELFNNARPPSSQLQLVLLHSWAQRSANCSTMQCHHHLDWRLSHISIRSLAGGSSPFMCLPSHLPLLSKILF